MALCHRTLGGERYRYAIAWRLDKSGLLTRWLLAVQMDAVDESGRIGARELPPGSAWVWRMSALTRDGTSEPISRDQ